MEQDEMKHNEDAYEKGTETQTENKGIESGENAEHHLQWRREKKRWKNTQST